MPLQLRLLLAPLSLRSVRQSKGWSPLLDLGFWHLFLPHRHYGKHWNGMALIFLLFPPVAIRPPLRLLWSLVSLYLLGLLLSLPVFRLPTMSLALCLFRLTQVRPLPGFSIFQLWLQFPLSLLHQLIYLDLL